VFWEPMAITMMGGLLVATILTLLFLPALYAACSLSAGPRWMRKFSCRGRAGGSSKDRDIGARAPAHSCAPVGFVRRKIGHSSAVRRARPCSAQALMSCQAFVNCPRHLQKFCMLTPSIGGLDRVAI
jgi:hypothetical protein